jgi:excisionase family DNA binding protein
MVLRAPDLVMREPGQNGKPSELLTVTEAARQAGVSRSTVAGWISAGHLPAVLHERRRRIRPADLATAQQTAHLGGVIPTWRADRHRAGRRLRQLREAAGLSQLALAERSGISHEVISRLETGRCWPKASTLRALAEALRLAPQQFVQDEPGGLSSLTVAEAARRLDVPPGRVQTWLKQGLLPGTKVSGQWRVLSVVVAELGRSGRLRGHSRRLDPRYRGD